MEILTSDDMTLSVSVDQDLCMGAESCVGIAPEVFSLDENQLGRRTSTEPLGMIEVEEGTVDSDKIIRAAKSCPYKAIHVRDAKTDDQLCSVEFGRTSASDFSLKLPQRLRFGALTGQFVFIIENRIRPLNMRKDHFARKSSCSTRVSLTSWRWC